jgi:hypothetical protein
MSVPGVLQLNVEWIDADGVVTASSRVECARIAAVAAQVPQTTNALRAKVAMLNLEGVAVGSRLPFEMAALRVASNLSTTRTWPHWEIDATEFGGRGGRATAVFMEGVA